MRIRLLLLLILIFAATLRLWHIATIPSGFHADEAAFGYNAYSILMTGKDEYGKFLPLVLKSFGDYKGAIYSYLDIPFVWIFGLTPFAVRIPTAIFGTLFVYVGFLFAKYFTKNNSIALLTAGLLSISPISIFLSRVQSDPLVSTVFALIGLYVLLLSLEHEWKWGLFWFALLSVTSIFTYASPRIFVPPLSLLVVLYFWRTLCKKKNLLILLLVSVSFVFVVDGLSILGHGDSRFQQLSIINSPAVMLPEEQQIREEGHSNVLLARVLHNKIVAHAQYVTSTYFSYMNFSFLFLKGGQPDREIIPNMGLMYSIEFPFLIFGLYLMFAKREKWRYLVGAWILVIPFLLSFALDETPNVHRFFFAVLPLEFLVAYGLYKSIIFMKKRKIILRVFLISILGIFAFSFLYFCDALFVRQPVHNPWYRGYAYKDLVPYVSAHQKLYKQVVITKSLSSPYIYFLFYEKYSPELYQKEGSPRDLDYTGFGQYLFVPEDCPLRPNKLPSEIQVHPDVLYVNKGSCPILVPHAHLLKTIYWYDGTPAFRIMTYMGK